MTRVEATATVKALLPAEVAAEVGRTPSLERLRGELPRAFGELDTLERAAWLELTTLLEPYLLAAQGDRVAMAHGVEGRYPFLDHRVFAFSAALPTERKLDGMRDKVALRELAAELLPAEIVERPKQPYRAPEVDPVLRPDAPDWVEEIALARRRWRRPASGTPSASTGLLRGAARAGHRECARGWRLVGILPPSSGTRARASGRAGVSAPRPPSHV